MKKCFYFIILSCIININYTTATIYAQVKTTPKNVRIDLPPDPENLDVFQQWIRWNNPGSLLINHLIKQAMDHYEIRDGEIARLKTRSEWMKRQVVVKESGATAQ